MRHTRFKLSINGCTKKFLKGINPSTGVRTLENLYFGDFEITTLDGVARKTDPIAIFLPYESGSYLNNIRIRSVGNTAIWTSDANNTRLDHIWVTGGGWGITNNEAASINYRYSILSGTNLLNADTGSPFVASDVGKIIYIGNAGTAAYPLAATISSQTGVQAVIDVLAPATATAQRVSWDSLKGSITSGLTTLTLDTDCVDAADVGRYIYVRGAGQNGGVLVTTIASRTSGSIVELTEPAHATSTSQDVWFTPMFFSGTMSHEFSSYRKTNDINLIDCYSEVNQGIDYLFKDGVNVKLVHTKSHGIGDDTTRCARHARNFVFDACRGLTYSGGELDYGYSKTGGNILICGGQSYIQIIGALASALPANQYTIDLDSSSASTVLEWIGGEVNKPDYLIEPGFIRFGASMAWDNIRGIGPTTRNYRAFSDYYIPIAVGGLETTKTLKRSGVISPPQITANQNDYSPTGIGDASVIRASTDATRTITGILRGDEGQMLRIENIGSQPISLAHESASSTAVNRILCGASVTVPPGGAVDLRYDAVSFRWRSFGHISISSYSAMTTPATADLLLIKDVAGAVTRNLSMGTLNTFRRAPVALTLANGANADVALPSNYFARIAGPTGAFSISGVVAPAAADDGWELTLYNSVAHDMTITNDALSTAANRILTLTGADVTLVGVSVVKLKYCAADSRWILLGTQG
jgi:hypothetical protein